MNSWSPWATVQGTPSLSSAPAHSFLCPLPPSGTGVRPSLRGMCSRPPSGYLKPWIALNPICTACFPVHTLLSTWKKCGFSLVYPNCQHHYSCALGTLLSKIRVTRTPAVWDHHSRPDTWDSHQVTNGGERIQCGSATQTDEGMSGTRGGREQDGMSFHCTTQNGARLKTYEVFISGIFHVISLNCSWPQVAETMDIETMEQRVLYFSFPSSSTPTRSPLTQNSYDLPSPTLFSAEVIPHRMVRENKSNYAKVWIAGIP